MLCKTFALRNTRGLGHTTFSIRHMCLTNHRCPRGTGIPRENPARHKCPMRQNVSQEKVKVSLKCPKICKFPRKHKVQQMMYCRYSNRYKCYKETGAFRYIGAPNGFVLQGLTETLVSHEALVPQEIQVLRESQYSKRLKCLKGHYSSQKHLCFKGQKGLRRHKYLQRHRFSNRKK